MEENNNYFENLFINADALIAENKISEGKELLEELLFQNPGYGKAHNHLGWIYHNKLSDIEKAREHLELAIKFNPKYSPSYLNLSYVFSACNDYDGAILLLNKALQNVPNMNKPTCYGELGRLYELNENYGKSIFYYKKAIKNALNQPFINDMTASIIRVKSKMTIFEKIKLIYKK